MLISLNSQRQNGPHTDKAFAEESCKSAKESSEKTNISNGARRVIPGHPGRWYQLINLIKMRGSGYQPIPRRPFVSPKSRRCRWTYFSISPLTFELPTFSTRLFQLFVPSWKFWSQPSIFSNRCLCCMTRSLWWPTNQQTNFMRRTSSHFNQSRQKLGPKCNQYLHTDDARRYGNEQQISSEI